MKCPHNHEVEPTVRMGIVIYRHKDTKEPCKMLNTVALSLERMNREYLKSLEPEVTSNYIKATIFSDSTKKYVIEKVAEEEDIEKVKAIIYDLHNSHRLSDDLVTLMGKTFGKYAEKLFEEIGLAEYPPFTKYNCGDAYWIFFRSQGMYKRKPKCLAEVKQNESEAVAQEVVDQAYQTTDCLIEQLERVVKQAKDAMGGV